MTDKNSAYLGDGLYAKDDGHMITLYTSRDGITHFVCLEPEVLEDMLRFIERTRGLKIEVTRTEKCG